MRSARHKLKSGDPSDQALAFLDRAAPPSPLQAGAPAWATPGPLRSPLHHQGRRSGTSRSACRSGLVRGRRSRPGQIHAGAPAWRGLRGVEYSKDARGRFEGCLERLSRPVPAPTLPSPLRGPLNGQDSRIPALAQGGRFSTNSTSRQGRSMLLANPAKQQVLHQCLLHVKPVLCLIPDQ